MEGNLPRSSARQAILLHLKKSPKSLSVDELANHLGITPMAVRRHLSVLESAELIQSSIERRPKGRPANVYSLSESAHDLFPSNYSGLLNVLLECLEETNGPEAVQTVFSRWKEKLVSFANVKLEGLDFDQRVKGLVELLEKEGFMPVLEKKGPGEYFLREHNCPIRKVASKYADACHFEREVYNELLNCEVERAELITNGDHCCSYRIVDPSHRVKRKDGGTFEV